MIKQILAEGQKIGFSTVEVFRTYMDKMEMERFIDYQARHHTQLDVYKIRVFWEVGEPVGFECSNPDIASVKRLFQQCYSLGIPHKQPNFAHLLPSSVQKKKINIFDEKGLISPQTNYEELMDRISESLISFPGLKLDKMYYSSSMKKTYIENTHALSAKYKKTNFKLQLNFSYHGNAISIAENTVYFSHIDPFKMISRAFNLLNSLAEGPHLLKKNEFLVLSPESSTLILKEFAQYFKCHPPAKQTDMQFPAVLSIADDAMLDFLPGSAPFDDEGMETSETYLIKKGKMEQKISDINSAFALGQPSTGNGFRLNRAIFPEINFSNLYIKPSVLSLKNLMKRSVNGILVSLIKLKFIELEDYIFSAYGFRYQNDELLEPVHFYFRTNFLSYFLNILNVSKEIKFFYHDYNIGSPYILVKAAALDDHILKI